LPFEVYGETLVLTRADDDDAVEMLRRAVLGYQSVMVVIHGWKTARRHPRPSNRSLKAVERAVPQNLS
jgi:hypothetical protein